MSEVFYTKEQKDVLKDLCKSDQARQMPMTASIGIAMLDALGEIANALQNIEQILQRIENTIPLDEQSR